MPTISIIMPSFNSEEYIGRSIDSALSQSFKDFEILIVDAGSTDNTKKISQSYADERVKFMELTGSKQGEARNCGIENSRGEFIMFLDSDDYLADNQVITDCLDFIRLNEADFFNFSVKFCEREKVIKSVSVGGNRIEIGTENITKLSLNGTYIHTIPWNKIFKRSFLQKKNLSFPKMKEQEDMVFIIDCCINADKVAFHNRDIVFAEVRPNSLSRRMSLENVLCCLEVFKEVEKLLIKHSLLDSCLYDFKNYVYRTSAYIMIMSTYRIEDNEEYLNALNIIKSSSYLKSGFYLYKPNALKLSTILSIIALKFDLILRVLRRLKKYKIIKGY